MNEADIPAAAVVGIAAGVDVHQRVNGDIVNVAQAVGVDLELGAVRANAHNTATEHREHGAVCAFCLVHAVVAHGDVDPAVNGHTHAIGGVICTTALVVRLAADVGNKYLGRAISFAVLVFVFKDTEVHGAEGFFVLPDSVDDVDFVSHGNQATRVVEGGKNSVLVGNAIVISITEPHNFSFARAFAERAAHIHADKDVTIWVGAEACWRGCEPGAGEGGLA